MELESVEDAVQSTVLLNRVGLDVELGDHLGDSGVEVVVPLCVVTVQRVRERFSNGRRGGAERMWALSTDLGHRG